MIKDILKEADEQDGQVGRAAREEFAAIRAGRATPAMFSKITADYYGTPTPIQQPRLVHRRPRPGSSWSRPTT